MARKKRSKVTEAPVQEVAEEKVTKTELDEFKLDWHIVRFLSENAFFAELSRHVRKIESNRVPTMGVTFDIDRDELQLLWNREFTTKLAKNPQHVMNVLKHEFYHIVFGHISTRRKTPHKLWNYATDLAINSLIVHSENSDAALPDLVLLPGKRPNVGPEGGEIDNTFADLIASLPRMQASDYYYEMLMKFMKDNDLCPECGGKHSEASGPGDSGAGGSAQGEPDGNEPEQSTASGNQQNDGTKCPTCGRDLTKDFGSFDDHSMWDNIPEEKREYVKNRIKAAVEKAVKRADQHSNGWGSIPAEMREAIRLSVQSIVPWRTVLRQFVGHLVRGARASSIKVINKRYPYVHPGQKRGYVAKLLIAIDQSGSVDDNMLTEFFSELNSLSKRVTIDLIPFDCSLDPKEVITWRKGQKIECMRTRCGGTDFDAPTDFVNDPLNRGRWDGMLIMTDGQAPAPKPSRVKRGWVLGKGTDLVFPNDELKIKLSDNASDIEGAWR